MGIICKEFDEQITNNGLANVFLTFSLLALYADFI